MASKTKAPKTKPAKNYKHPESESPMRPEVGTQAQFKKKLPPKTYRYDSSISPALDWDGKNSVREQGEALIQQTLEAKTLEEAKAAASKLKAMSIPFLNWAGKAERLSFDVPTLPLFIHERLSTKAILETLKGHRFDRNQATMFDLWGDPQHSVTDQVLRAYEYQDKWVNRMILGDSLVVMNSLLRYEGLGGQVQMVYLDPPYAVSFGSNFQPFIRKREVSHGDDEDMTREPETVQAYRDTWELGLHSYLTYLRDRFLLARELLHPTGSIFVQISDRNVHVVRTVLEEVFGQENFVVSVILKKKGSQKGELVDPINDYLLWFAKDLERCRERFHKLYDKVELSSEISSTFRYVQLADGKELTLKELGDSSENQNGGKDYFQDPAQVLNDFPGARLFASENLTSGGFRKNQSVIYKFRGRDFDPGIARGNCWKHTAKTDDGSPSGLDKLAGADRLFVSETQLRYKRFLSDFGYREMTNIWEDIAGAANPVYVVQTNTEIVKRCLLMTTEPGDLVLDPTCGSGTTAYVAEQWGRRWITIDTSRVPLALARQRLLTATFPWYRLKDESRGPVGGFEYKQRRNKKGEEVGGIVPHVMSSTIANDESPEQELLVDRPEENSAITRVTGPFCFEATIPTPLDFEEMKSGSAASESEFGGSFVDRMLEVLRRSPVLRLEGNKTAVLRNVRLPAKTLSLSAEAVAPNGAEKLVAFVFGPENGAVSEKLVYEAAREAHAKSYSHLYVIGFAVQPNARMLIDKSAEVVGIPATYVQATPDLMMGDLLKNMRSSQIFSVCGLPEIEVRRVKSKNGAPKQYEVELLGLDVFDPVEMMNHKSKGDDVPAWFLDTDYNDTCFHVNQAFFPRTGALEALKKALRGEYEEMVWDHLAGTVSAPFEPGDEGQIAVKVIDDRGNELLVVKKLKEAK
jgi:adenine-specific DNA-methyltransferase